MLGGGGQESALSLQLQIDEISNSIFHLTRSNSELEAALQQEPGDVDFMEAVAENLIALDRKRATVVALRKKLAATTGHKCGDAGEQIHSRIASAPPAPTGPQSFASVPTSSGPPAFVDDMPSIAAMAATEDRRGRTTAPTSAQAPSAAAAADTAAAVADAIATTAAPVATTVTAEAETRPGISL